MFDYAIRIKAHVILESSCFNGQLGKFLLSGNVIYSTGVNIRF